MSRADIPASAVPGFSIGTAISGFAPVGANTGRLLLDSNSTINAIVADIDAATEHVHLLFYIWLPDRNGRKVIETVVGAPSRSHYVDLLDAGVHLYEYVGGLLHTKSLTVDGAMMLIDSANMDRRSFDLNFENNILVYDTHLTQTLRRRQEEYIAQSKPVSPTDVTAWSWRYRLRNNVMAILSPVL